MELKSLHHSLALYSSVHKFKFGCIISSSRRWRGVLSQAGTTLKSWLFFFHHVSTWGRKLFQNQSQKIVSTPVTENCLETSNRKCLVTKDTFFVGRNAAGFSLFWFFNELEFDSLFEYKWPNWKIFWESSSSITLFFIALKPEATVTLLAISN